MTKIITRIVSPTDYKDIYELNCDLGYEYPIEKTEQRIRYFLMNTQDTIIVAELDNEVVGYIHGGPYEMLYSDSYMEVLEFAVKGKVRGIGIGYLLINELENIAKERAFKGMRLVTGYDRIQAHKFYERQGYIYKKGQKIYIKSFM